MPKPTRVEQQKKGRGSYNRANWRKDGDIDQSENRGGLFCFVKCAKIS